MFKNYRLSILKHLIPSSLLPKPTLNTIKNPSLYSHRLTPFSFSFKTYASHYLRLPQYISLTNNLSRCISSKKQQIHTGEKEIVQDVKASHGLEEAQVHLDEGIQFSLEGDLEKASSELNKALDIQVRLLGEDNYAVGKTYMELGIVHQAWKKNSEALEYYNQSLRIFDESGEEKCREDLALMFEFIGDMYEEETKLEDSIAFYQEAIDIRKLIQEDTGAQTNYESLYEKIGDCCTVLARYRQAKEFYLEALDICKQASEIEDTKISDLHQLVGYCEMQLESYPEALEQYNKALEALGKKEETSFEVVEVWSQIAETLYKMEDYDKSIGYDKKVLDFYVKNKLIGRTKEVYERLGKAYESQGKEGEAYEIYKDGMLAHLDYYRAHHPNIESLYAVFKDMYERRRGKDDIEKIEKKMKEIRATAGEEDKIKSSFMDFK